MSAKIIKLNKKDDIAVAVKLIKDTKDREIVFELEKGALLLKDSTNLRLLKKTGEVLGKKVLVRTSDSIGKLLAAKAGMLEGDEVESRKVSARFVQSDSQHGFSDILSKKKILPLTTALSLRGTKPQGPLASIPLVAKLHKHATKLVLTTLGILLVLIVVALVVLPRASIVIYARSEPVSRDLEVTVDQNAKQVDSSSLTIPGQLIKKEASQTKNFPTSGQKLEGSKASGKVTIYNFTSHTLTLRASTTTLIADGKKYFFTSDITGVKPSTKTSSGPIVPVVAQQPGEAYNLPAQTKFTIQNQALGNRPEVYAQNEEAFAGGTSQAQRILSQEDFDKALASLIEEMVRQVQDDLNVGGQNIKLLSSATNKEILAKTANKNAGEEATNFDMTVIARIEGLAYQEEDVKNLLLTKILEVLSQDKYLVEGAAQNLTANFKSLDLTSGKGVLVVHFETVVAYRINEGNLSKILAGKNAAEINEILLTKPEIDRLDVKFRPFYVKHAPRLNGKIYINTVLSN